MKPTFKSFSESSLTAHVYFTTDSGGGRFVISLGTRVCSAAAIAAEVKNILPDLTSIDVVIHKGFLNTLTYREKNEAYARRLTEGQRSAMKRKAGRASRKAEAGESTARKPELQAMRRPGRAK